MAIGYACLLYGDPRFKLKSCTLKTATPSRLLELTSMNLETLSRMIDYNIENRIMLFRISSDIVPFGSHSVNNTGWRARFVEELSSLGEKISKANMRVSMHPGQYTVINSPREDVVERSIADLEYHCNFLDSMNLDSSHKIILHIGGVYGDKSSAIERFCSAYSSLSPSIRSRLVVENDEKSYTIEDVLSISKATGAPAVFDNLHHYINPPQSWRSESEWIDFAKATWGPDDGVQKIHYSQQKEGGKPGAHSQSISLDPFMDFYRSLESPIPDIMLEVKDKNLSALKCSLCVSNPDIGQLQREWSRYKYLVMFHSHSSYLSIRSMFSSEALVSPLHFYGEVESALSMLPTVRNMSNAFSHVWGYFKKLCTEKERASFKSSLEKLDSGSLDSARFKRFLYRLAEKYRVEYLLDSYFFRDAL